mmetsp:Transcript_518/g.1038  ORF Transcript_518/g.1038 Transcript_518/m.1038 type:complete len:186 (-) Transcript_518:307-864(-)|eukprot:CAMPEP_0172310178 /NCGR_PEP_ID=MMETSP1058-20130122/11335_1 /TAXON_ID=83371 /ORGANISM="Detonula confervacea, Strain CCMP 353" /LENGTH=185 /DNA_ID=CAMNT_0013022947 /DNA_START=81 /DNA_END=638 /DNA_ORIENTATION=-
MNKLASTLAIFAAIVPSTLAFSATKINARSSATATKQTCLNYHPDSGGFEPQTETYAPHPSAYGPQTEAQTYDRALDCVNNFGMCDIDELMDLSEDLDQDLGCFVDNGPEACENEINDRQHLAEALLVQGEMMEHERYVQEGNVFPQDANQNIQVNEQDTSSPRPSEWRNEDDFYWANNGPSLGP